MKNEIFCRVCGFEAEDFPWGVDGKHASFEICACCGTQFGYEDATIIGIKRKRAEWISNDYDWFLPEEKPSDWNPITQMNNIPDEYK